MDSGMGISRIRSLATRVSRCCVAVTLLISASLASAQNEYWPVATLQPPGLGAQLTPIAGVALAGDFAVTVYQPTAALGYRVFLRKRNTQGWDAPQLLVQGQPGEGQNIAVSADADHIAIGLPKGDTNGRVDVYVRNGLNWALQQSIPAAPGAPPAGGITSNFGLFVSIAGTLLTVSSSDLSFTSQHDTYRYDTAVGSWVDAGFSQWNPLSTSTIAKTDGQRVVACYNTACSIRLFDTSGSIPGGGSIPFLTSFTTAGEWIFGYANGALGAYQLSGNAWTLRQQFGAPFSYVVSSGKLKLRPSSAPVMQFYEVDQSGVWQVVSNVDDPAPTGGNAINQSLALSGIQSFARQNGAWSPSGTVEGVADVASFRFGTAVSLAANHVWIGSPRHNNDFASGAIWMEPMDGNSLAFPRFVDAPYFSASGVGFGQAIATDGVRVAVASLPDYGDSPLKIRIYSANSIAPIVADITAPPTAARAAVVDIAIHGNTIALLRAVSGAVEVLVYVDNGAGYALNQTINLPSSTPWKVTLFNDLLLVGQSQFQRVGSPTANFSPIDPVLNPPGVALNFSRASRYGTLLVAAANFPDSGEALARVFSFTPTGWIYSGDLNRGAFSNAFCFYPAAGPFPSNNSDRIACVTGTTLGVATRNPVGSDWTLTRSATVPGLTTGPTSINAVAIEGDRVAIGESATSDVVVVDISESIFSAGFDQ